MVITTQSTTHPSLNKIVPLLAVYLKIGRRSITPPKARLLTQGFYFLMAFIPLMIGAAQDTKFGTGLAIVGFASYNFVLFGSLRAVSKTYIQLHQIKIYPLSDRLIFRLLWVIELLDYTLLMFLVPSLGGILLLYPDFYVIALFLICLSLSYALMTLLVSVSKLLISHYPPTVYVVALFCAALYVASLSIGGLESQDSIFIHEFVSSWRIQILSFCIFLFVLILLCNIGTLIVSKIHKISK